MAQAMGIDHQPAMDTGDEGRGEQAIPAVSAEPGAPLDAEGLHLPAPSVWPVVCAAGVTLLLFGVVTSLAFSVAGIVVIAAALSGWVGELRRG